MPTKADLHIHSTASDGMMTPGEIVKTAEGLNLNVIALTDHDSIEGISAARKAASKTPVTVINGAEITVCFDNREIHLLAYAFDLENKKLNECLRKHKIKRVERAKVIIGHLQKEGLELSIDEVLAEASSRNVCRPHIAAVLVSKGYVATLKEAFLRYLSDEKLGKLNNFYHSLEEVVMIVKQAGGVAVIAHPGRLYTEKQLKKIVASGIDGVETAHPAHSYDIQQYLEQFAEKNNLLTTGGSDFHGKRKKYYRYFGTLGVNEKQVQKVERLAAHRKNVERII